MKKLPALKWVFLMFVLFVFVVGLSACTSETPVAEQPLPEQATATMLPKATELPTADPEVPEATAAAPETPKISQPSAGWNSVSEPSNWVLIGYGDVLNPTVVEPGTFMTIDFSATDDQVSGSAGCNNYFTSYRADDDHNLTINGPVGSTRMACETGMEQEALFLSALETVSDYNLTEDGHLLLTYNSGTVYAEQLIFIPQEALVDTIWVLTAFGTPSNLTSSEIGVVTTAIFSADGTVSGSTGCNNYSAGYSLTENQISISLPIANQMVCETGMEQEQEFLTLLETAQNYRLGIDALEITADNGKQVLRFSAQPLPLENVRWQLASINGQPLPVGVSANVIFTPAHSPAAQGAENSVNGNAGCNDFSGSYNLTGDTFTAVPFGVTQMMCEENAMRVEYDFLTGLENAQKYQITTNQLAINTPSGLLLFYADRLPLEGPRWILTGSGAVDNPQPPIAGAIFTASFSREFGMPSGVKSGATGCSDYSAPYYASFNHIKVNLPVTTRVACSDTQTEAEQGYFLGLNAARDYRILGNELYVYFDDSVLIFIGSYPTLGEEVGPLAPLDGTKWWLTSLDTFVVVPGSETTLLFAIDDKGKTGTISGSGGCNNYTAEITSGISLSLINASAAFCGTPEGIMEQEAAYLSALQNANGFRIDGETLKITTSQETLYFTSRGPEAGQPLPVPQAVIIAPSDENAEKVITFDGSLSTSNAKITSYHWWFSDNTTADGMMVERTYNAVGAYDAILTITDAIGQKSEASIKVHIHESLVGPVWVLDSSTITLIFGDGVLSGNAGCNDYNAGYSGAFTPGKSNTLSVSPITNTGKSCDADVMNQEGVYLANLKSATSYIINNDRLTLNTTGGQLFFYPAVASP